MQSSIYLLPTIFLIILFLAALIIIHYKKNSHTQLYSEGVRNENAGQYQLEKILRTTMDYEKSFQTTPVI